MGGARTLVLGLSLVTLAPASCGEEVTGEDVPAAVVDEALTRQQSPLRRRWRVWRPAPWGDAAAPVVVGGSAGTGGLAGSGGSAGGGGGTGGAAMTVSGGGADSVPFVSGGRCPNNAPMPAGGPCGPYGVNCTYDAADGTHYCTCLNSGPTGTQGWTCR